MSDRSGAARPQSGSVPDSGISTDLAELARLLQAFGGPQGQAYQLEQSADGRIVVVTPDGERVSFAGTELLARAIAGRFNAFAEELRMQQVDIDRVLGAMERQRIDEPAWAEMVFKLDRLLADLLPRDGSLTWQRLGHVAETHDMRPFDAGKIGRGIGHLPVLPSEDMIFASSDRRLVDIARVDASDTDPRSETVREVLGMGGVGSSFGHLPPMPDGARDVIVDRRPNAIEDGFARRFDTPTRTPVPSVPVADRIALNEDGSASGNLLDNDKAGDGQRDVRLEGTPPPGLFTLTPDGRYTYVPTPNLSGTFETTYSYIDAATGQRVIEKILFTVAPVADAPLLGVPAGTLSGLEDTPLALTGLSGTLADTDGSETATFQLAGVPAGASFGGPASISVAASGGSRRPNWPDRWFCRPRPTCMAPSRCR